MLLVSWRLHKMEISLENWTNSLDEESDDKDGANNIGIKVFGLVEDTPDEEDMMIGFL